MKMFRKLVSIVAAATILTSSLAFSISAHAAQVDDTSAVSSEPNTQDDVNNGVVLHAFNWSYNSIKLNLPQIKAAGYSAVQTSPVTQPKDFGPWSDVAGQWPKLYQPVSESVSDSGWLGTKAELAAMCEEADKYGIKIIVDIVANHMANYKLAGTNTVDANKLSDEVKTYEPELYNGYSQYFHSERSNASDSSPQLMVQGHVSECPDLNTGNSFVQQKILSLLKECIDCGVDGFRFDAAKHIETEKDGNYGSQFWVNTLDQAKSYYTQKTGKSLFAYGEILNGIGGRNLSGYTDRMRVTENNYSDKILAGFNGGNASYASATNYSLSGNATKAVVWAESHDTYMGESGSAGLKNTANVSDANVVKAWAVVAARKDSVPLYFARPGDAMMGQAAGDLTYKSTVVSEVNKFHNFFAGKSEKVGNANGIIYVARDGKGVVLSKVNGTSGSVNVAGTGLADGSYVDTVTGSTFTVSGGTVSGNIGDTGVAVVYQSTATPKAVASVESGEFTTDTITVELSLENAVKGTYALENYAATEFTGKTAIKIGRDYNVGETITLNLTATDAAGNTTTGTYFYKKKPSTSSGIFVFLHPNICKSWNNPCCYVYDEDTKSKKICYSNGGWPGQQMTYDEQLGYYYIEIPARCVEQDLTTGKIQDSDFNLPQSPNTFVIFNGTSKYSNQTTQYPGAAVSAGNKLSLGGGTSNKVLENAKASGWKNTTMTPTKAEIPATEVLKGGEQPTTEEPTTEGTTAPPEPETRFVQKGIYGDVDGNGKVDVNDVTNVQRHLAEFSPQLTGDALKAADVDKDGDVTIKDVTYMQMYIAEFPDGFAHAGEPYGEYVVVGEGDQTFKVTATSNLFAKHAVDFNENTATFTVTYFINSEKDLLSTDWTLSYDSTAVSPKGTTFMPNVSGVMTGKKDGTIKGNISNINLDALKAEGNKPIPFVSATFDVLTPKDSTVTLNVSDLTVSKLNAGETTSKAANETDIVENSEIKKPDSKYNLYTSIYEGSLNKNRDVSYDPTVFYDPNGEPTTAPETTVQPEGTRTILFTNNKGWDQVYIHYWGGADETAWPGVPMQDAGTNGYGEPQYSFDIPTDCTGFIFNDGQAEGGQQTVDVAYDDVTTGWYPTAEKDDEGHWLVEGWIADDPLPTDGPTPIPGGTRRIEFTDNLGWGQAYIYFWGSAQEADPEWPGYPMNKIDGDNGYGGTNYWYDVPTDVTGIIFNNGQAEGGQQTVDIPYDDTTTGWYPTGEQDSEGKLTVDSWTSGGGDEPGGTRNILFTDNKGWGSVNIHYWGGATETEWPGVAMTPAGTNDYGEQQYSFAVPTDTDGMVFNGPGGQTVDVYYDSTSTGWYPLDSMDANGHFEVGSWSEGGSTTLDGDYYLVGFINGVDVSETDNHFNGNTITMTFTEDSYVCIRDAAGNWFMTNGFQGTDVTRVTLYPTSITGEDSNKMYAPAGEVTFTLSKNSDGTFNLSTDGSGGDDPVDHGETREIQFTNNQGWSAVYAYAWNDGGELLGQWPGSEMTNIGDNGFGNDNFSISVPVSATNIIFSNGSSWDAPGGAQTVDIAYNNKAAGWYLTTETDGKWNASAWYTGGKEIEFTSPGWTTVYCYAWDDDDLHYLGDWPGSQMTYKGDNGFGGTNYAVTVPEGATHLIFHNGEGDQTVDADYDGSQSGYYCDGGWSDKKRTVQSW